MPVRSLKKRLIRMANHGFKAIQWMVHVIPSLIWFGVMMKIEIEIEDVEAEISAAVQRKVKSAINEYVAQSWRDDEIRLKIKQFWNETVDVIIKEELAKSEVIRDKVIKAIEFKLKSQITTLMKIKE